MCYWKIMGWLFVGGAASVESRETEREGGREGGRERDREEGCDIMWT